LSIQKTKNILGGIHTNINWKSALVLVLLLVLAAAAGYFYLKHDHAVIMQQQEIQNAAKLAQALNIKEAEAKTLQAKLAEAQNKPPVVSYHVTERTVEKAAEQVRKDIDAGTSPANKIPADKTIVTPNTDQQKVDVYRITMDKPRAIGAYVSTESAGIMAQYKGATVFGGPRYHGGYEIGIGYLIRF
jgi:hypothetical protein